MDMYVCVCNAVTESDIDEAVERGARAVGDLREQLLVATCCGSCEETAQEYLSASLRQRGSVRQAGAHLRCRTDCKAALSALP
jgi:bacterioferritin-associated ferredoxin